MNNDWMDRYRGLVGAIAQHTNVMTKLINTRREMADGIFMTSVEWQVMEYLIEHRDENKKMIAIADALGFSQSTFSKTIRSLREMGLAERYRSAGNKKDIIPKPTPLAMEIYARRTEQMSRAVFGPFFDALKDVSDRDIDAFARAIRTMTERILEENGAQPAPEKPELIRID